MSVPIFYHVKAATGYIPVIHQKQKFKNKNENEFKSKSKHKHEHENKREKILTSHDFKSLIVTALIFLTIFAWTDVFASIYKGYYLKKYNNNINNNKNKNMNNNNNLAGFISPDIIHKLPKHQIPRENIDELDSKAKIGYASILTIATCAIWLILSKI